MGHITFIRHGRTFALGALVAALSAVAVVGLNAWAADEPASGPRAEACPGHFHHAMAERGGRGDMHGMGRHGGHGGPGGMGMLMGGRHFERMLDDVDATAAQREQIKGIRDKALPQAQALMDEGGKLHEQAAKLWGEPKLDAAAAEKLRQQMQAHHDKMSKHMSQTMLDIGKVLTPEQRAKMSERMLKAQAAMQKWKQGDRPQGMQPASHSGRPMDR